ncbi:hypothetical protein DMUE_3992 [Dictyocoela muelleri]|nr:hypothetical protein DMUE_3992 [Dictyocoela muelleri]
MHCKTTLTSCIACPGCLTTPTTPNLPQNPILLYSPYTFKELNIKPTSKRMCEYFRIHLQLTYEEFKSRKIITSTCPAVVGYAERQYYHVIPFLSKIMTTNQMAMNEEGINDKNEDVMNEEMKNEDLKNGNFKDDENKNENDKNKGSKNPENNKINQFVTIAPCYNMNYENEQLMTPKQIFNDDFYKEYYFKNTKRRYLFQNGNQVKSVDRNNNENNNNNDDNNNYINDKNINDNSINENKNNNGNYINENKNINDNSINGNKNINDNNNNSINNINDNYINDNNNNNNSINNINDNSINDNSINDINDKNINTNDNSINTGDEQIFGFIEGEFIGYSYLEFIISRLDQKYQVKIINRNHIEIIVGKYRLARIYGLENLHKIYRKGFEYFNYDFIELFVCKGGCFNGPGLVSGVNQDFEINKFDRNVRYFSKFDNLEINSIDPNFKEEHVFLQRKKNKINYIVDW